MASRMCHSALWKQRWPWRGDSRWAVAHGAAGCAAVRRGQGSAPWLSLRSQRQEGQGWSSPAPSMEREQLLEPRERIPPAALGSALSVPLCPQRHRRTGPAPSPQAPPRHTSPASLPQAPPLAARSGR